MDLQHIYWFPYFNRDEPSVRYRAQFPLAQLQEQYHISYSIAYPGHSFKSLISFLGVFLSALFFRKRNSVIVFQKIYTNGLYAKALKLLLYFRPQHTLYDIDDAEHTRRCPKTMHHFMKHCTACSAGSASLVEYIKPFNPQVFLLTSPVIDHGLTSKPASNKIFTVGWIGYYAAHRESLTTLFFPALHYIDFPLRLKLLGVGNREEEQEIRDYFKNNPNIMVEAPLNLDWLDERSIYEHITSFDIGVSPLMDNEFNRSKSAFKLKQCLSCGVPVLGSRVGENKAFLEHGVNGYFCDGPDEYLQHIKAMKNDPNSDYARFCIRARSGFPGFSLDHYCATFVSYFRQLSPGAGPVHPLSFVPDEARTEGHPPMASRN